MLRELKRIITRKTVLIAIVVLLLNAVIVIVENYNNRNWARVYDELISQTISAHQNDELYFDDARTVVGNNRDRIKNSDLDFNFLKDKLFGETRYIDNFSKTLDDRTTSAEYIIRSEVFKKNSFEYLNTLQTYIDISECKQKEAKLNNSVWFEVLYKYNIIGILSILITGVAVYGFLQSRKSAIHKVIHSTPNGRSKRLFKRIGLIGLISLTVNFIVYLTTIYLNIKIYGGKESLQALVMSNSNLSYNTVFSTCTLSQACVYMWLFSSMTTFAVSVFYYMFISLFENNSIGTVCFGVIILAFVVSYTLISSKSKIRFLKYYNLYYLIFPHKAMKYYNWGYDSYIRNIFESTLVSALVISVISIILLYILYVKKYNAWTNNVIEKYIIYITELVMRVVFRLPQIIKEMYKILISQKVLFILLIIIGISTKIDIGLRTAEGPNKIYLNTYYSEAHGLEYSDELQKICDNYEEEYNQICEKYKDIPECENLLANRKALLNIIKENVDYIREVNNEGEKACVVKPDEYMSVWGNTQFKNQRKLSYLCCICALAIGAVFGSYEKKTGVYSIARSSERRKQWYFGKWLASFAIITTTYLIIYGIYYYKLLKLFPIHDFGIYIYSISNFRSMPINISFGTMMVLAAIYQIIIINIIMFVAILVSKYVRYPVGFVLSGVIITPFLMLGIDIISFFPLWIK